MSGNEVSYIQVSKGYLRVKCLAPALSAGQILANMVAGIPLKCTADVHHKALVAAKLKSGFPSGLHQHIVTVTSSTVAYGNLSKLPWT